MQFWIVASITEALKFSCRKLRIFWMKTRRRFLTYIAHIIFYITLPLQASASSGVIQRGLGATLVCPFTVTGGPKSIGSVTVACYSDITCTTYTGSNYSWGGRGGTPTLTNGTHTLSNDAMANVALTTACANAGTQCLQLVVQNPAGSITAPPLSMQATVISGTFTCTTSGTLNISSF
jgi:hypothetical protein